MPVREMQARNGSHVQRGVAVGSFLAQLLLFQLPFTRRIFQIAELSAIHIVWAGALALLPVTLVELTKLARRAVAGHATSA